MNKNPLKLLLIIGILATIIDIRYTLAFGFHDYEDTASNVVSSATLDMELSSEENGFDTGSDSLYRGDEVSREITVSNVGELPFLFRKEYEYTSGEEVLCSVLELKVYHEDTLLYSGALVNFELFSDGPLTDEMTYLFELSLPDDAPYEVSSKSCLFNVKATAWQTDFADETQGFWDEEWLDNDVATSDWPPEVPTGITIINHNGDNIGCSSTTNNVNILLDWNDSTEFDLDYYNVEDQDNSFVGTPLVSELAIELPEDGDYAYRVLSVDLGSNTSPWSDWCPVTLDTSLDEGEFGDVIINEVMWMGSSEHELDEWVELYNDTDEEINLEGWKLWVGGPAGHPIILTGNIEAHGYFLIVHYPTNHAKGAINDSIVADLVDDAMHLRDQGEHMLLEDIFGNIVDESDLEGWPAGEQGSKGQKKPWRSMERNDDPETGWHACTDEVCNDDTYWDENDGDDYGTPRSENHSEGDVSDNDREEGSSDDADEENYAHIPEIQAEISGITDQDFIESPQEPEEAIIPPDEESEFNGDGVIEPDAESSEDVTAGESKVEKVEVVLPSKEEEDVEE